MTRRWLWRVVGALFVATALGVVVVRLARDWDEVRQAASTYSLATWVAACAAIVTVVGHAAPVRMLMAWGRGVTRMYVGLRTPEAVSSVAVGRDRPVGSE